MASESSENLWKRDIRDIAKLPSVSLLEWKHLPRGSGLYFVQVVETCEVVYIGQSRNCRARWYSHVALINEVEGFVCRIAWLSLPIDNLNRAELEAISYWKPRLNHRPGGNVICEPEKFLTTMRLSPEGKRLLTLLSKQCGISHTAIMELAIREKASRELPDAQRNQAIPALSPH